MLTGTVRQTGGGRYRIALDDGRVVSGVLRGRLKREARTGDKVVIGDRVRVAEEEGSSTFVVEEVLPRVREIARAAPGGRRAKVVAANVNRLVVVSSARDPDPHRPSIDRLLLIGEVNDLDGALVVNKLDLDGARETAQELADVYRGIGYPVFATSARSGEGIEELRAFLCSGTSAFVGPSGAGKSSLLNRIQPDLELRTGELGRKRRGRHTTVTARLLELDCGGLVADTPGFSDIGLWEAVPEELDRCFPEMIPYLGECRFRGCSHAHEPECAIRAAVERGAIDGERYESYRALLAEAEKAASSF